MRPLVCFLLFTLVSGNAIADSWFRADRGTVLQLARKLADSRQPDESRMEALRRLRILFATYGAFNFEPTLPLLRKAASKPSALQVPSAELLQGLQTARKRRDRRGTVSATDYLSSAPPGVSLTEHVMRTAP